MAVVRIALALAAGCALALAGCQSAQQGDTVEASGKSVALRTMERVAAAAHRCWFASRDPAFRDYSFANELNSFSGRPRFLLVPNNDFGARPLLVVEARGQSDRVTTFGPLLDTKHGPRIAADLGRWQTGGSDCA